MSSTLRFAGALALVATLPAVTYATPDPALRDLSGPWASQGSGPRGAHAGTVWLHQTGDEQVQANGDLRLASGTRLAWSGRGRLRGNTLTIDLRLRTDNADLGGYVATYLLSANDTLLSGVWAPSSGGAQWRDSLRHPPTPTNSATPAPAASAPPIGVLLASHGDIDDLAEVEDYVRTAFVKNDAVPMPGWLRPPLAGAAWLLAKDNVLSQYEAIGATRYRENSRKQCDAISTALRSAGISAVVDYGFNFAPPFVEDALERMRAAGVRRIVVFNQGAQFSYATGGENIKDVVDYLEANPAWQPDIVAVKEFSSDPRFRRLLGDAIERDVRAAFPGVPTRDICILMVSHGLPLRLIEMGDPATDQMVDVVGELRGRFSDYGFEHGFLNDDFFPGAAWTTPKAIDTAHAMTFANWPYVYIDSRLSFTVHHRATLFDAEVEVRQMLEEELPTLRDGSPHPLLSRTRVVFGDNFDGDPAFARFIAQLTREALSGQGRIVRVVRGMTITP